MRLTEVMQTKSMRFAFAYLDGESVVQVMPLVKCRDFLKEQIIYTYTGRAECIYGFNPGYNTKNCKDYTGFILSIPKEGERIRFMRNFHILVEYEKALGFTELSEVLQFDNPELLFVKGDPVWQEGCFNISLYSLLLRALTCELDGSFLSITKGGDSETSDGKMWQDMDMFHKITSRQQLVDFVKKENYFPDTSVDTIHNYTGAYYMLVSRSKMESKNVSWMVKEYEDIPTWVENW